MSYLQAAQLQSNHLVQFFIRYLPNEQSSVWGVCDPSAVQGGQKSQLTGSYGNPWERRKKYSWDITYPHQMLADKCLEVKLPGGEFCCCTGALQNQTFHSKKEGNLCISVCFHQFFPQARGSRREAADECCVQGARKGCGPFIMRQTPSYL